METGDMFCLSDLDLILSGSKVNFLRIFLSTGPETGIGPSEPSRSHPDVRGPPDGDQFR